MPGEYNVQVAAQSQLSPHMRRVEFVGEALADFPDNQESGYVKLQVPVAGGGHVMRSYTIRHFNLAQRRLVMDFVDHGDAGPASHWVRHCAVGEHIIIRGPGEKKLVDPAADWYLIAGDLSALPALSVNVEQLRADARGYVVIEVPDQRDIQPLEVPNNMSLRWMVNPDGSQPNRRLVDEVLQLKWLPGQVYPWFAGEFEAMRQMRRYFRDERMVPRQNMYVSCYWKLGDSDEGMKQAKRLDAEADARAQAIA
ncbi:MAG: siderophore-interacting protein [Pseudomonadota bacterium]